MTHTITTKSVLKTELGVWIGIITTAVFLLWGKGWLADLSNPIKFGILFTGLFSIMLWLSFGVVRHADCLAVKLGEPFGTLILTLSVISIEIVMISAVMLNGENNPALGRDMMFAVVMIVLNLLIGLSLFLGAWRHVEQQYNLQGANTYLTVLIPLAIISLIIPDFTRSTAYGTLSTSQMIFVTVCTLLLYGSFLLIQTMRHQGYFIAPGEKQSKRNLKEHGGLIIRSVPFHALFLVAYMLPIVLLSKSMAIMADYVIDVMKAPAALGGVLVAILVLSPEGASALKAALNNQLQRSINICLGSALATISLTVPAVMLIGLLTGKTIVLGLDPVDSILLILTLAVTAINLSSTRSNVIHGLVHLILFVSYIVLLFD